MRASISPWVPGRIYARGAPLARLQENVVLEGVSARLSDLRLVPGPTPKFAPNVSRRTTLGVSRNHKMIKLCWPCTRGKACLGDG
jgi:hypothetical protein